MPPMTATLSIRGLLVNNPNLLDGWTLPASVPLDRLTAALLQECSELELLFPDPYIFKKLTDAWTVRKLPGWQRAYAAMIANYNPIHNFDRTETYTDTESGNESRTDRVTGSGTQNGGVTTEKKVSAYNENTYQPAEKDQTTQNASSSSNVTDTLTATNGRTLSHSAHLAGNIGITTSQQMVTDEINLSTMLDLTALIVKDFKAEFCLLVY